MSPRLLLMLIVFHGVTCPVFDVDVVSLQVQKELLFVVASL